MAFTDVINDDIQGAAGYILDMNGETVSYTVTQGSDSRDDQHHGDQSAFLYAHGAPSKSLHMGPEGLKS
jgi:hypothetical protein